MNIRINRYFMVITSTFLSATVNLAIAAEKLTMDQMKGVTAGAISISADANSNFGAFARASGSTAETDVKIGDTFARARGTANALGPAGGASSNAKAIGIPGTRPVPPSAATDIPKRGSFPAKRLKLRPFRSLR